MAIKKYQPFDIAILMADISSKGASIRGYAYPFIITRKENFYGLYKEAQTIKR